jgi:predicted Rossmann fold flavoprotein
LSDSGADLVVVGAGAAGLMAATFAARTRPGARVVLLEGARSLGAKILVSGGARCNVTHEQVRESDFSGSTPAAVRRVLRRFGVDDTIAFFREQGVTLKREETGKLFPTTDRARSVLDALLAAARGAGVALRHPWRVEEVERRGPGFVLRGPSGGMETPRLVLATGGRSLPKSGSDGHGYALARALGHTVTARVWPALVPLVVADGHYIRGLAGVTVPARLEVRAGSGKRLAAFTDSTLCTHFGLSGPSALNVSRHLIAARVDDPQAGLLVSWLPGAAPDEMEAALVALGPASVGGWLARRMPARLADAVCAAAGVDPALPGHRLARPSRRALVAEATGARVPVVGDRGWNEAEVTAGGVPLAELHLHTLRSRACEGLSLCGELLDVDGRIGGFNFQWAWASGYVVGAGAWSDPPDEAEGGTIQRTQ